jgi:hypothetical protein
MSTTVTTAPNHQRSQTEASDKKMQEARDLYETALKSKLEPEYNNQFIAIEPDSEEYAIANSTGNAMRAMRKRHATGRLLLMKIGLEPEYGLAARILASDMAAGDKAKGNLLQAEMQTGGEVSLEPL